MKELMALIAGSFGQRYTIGGKTKFLRFLSAFLKEKGIDATLSEKRGKGMAPCRNVVAGRLGEASLVLAVPYDTGSRLLLPKGGYRPADAKHNYRQDKINMLLNTVLALGLFLLYFLLILRRFFSGGAPLAQILAVAGMALLALFGLRLLGGWPNKNNYDRHSSTLALLLDGLLNGKWGKRTTLVLMDKSCCSLEGASRLAKQMKAAKSGASVLLLDSVCAGDTLFIHYRQGMRQQARQIARTLEGEYPVCLNLIADEQADTMVLSCFSRALLLTGGQEENGVCVVHNTRCGKDRNINLRKMERLSALLERAAAELG